MNRITQEAKKRQKVQVDVKEVLYQMNARALELSTALKNTPGKFCKVFICVVN